MCSQSQHALVAGNEHVFASSTTICASISGDTYATDSAAAAAAAA